MLDQLKTVGSEAYTSKVDDLLLSSQNNLNFTYSKDGLNYQVYLKKDSVGQPYLDNIHLE